MVDRLMCPAVGTLVDHLGCIGGVSHNETEAITQEWAEAGANVLLHAMLHSTSDDDSDRTATRSPAASPANA